MASPHLLHTAVYWLMRALRDAVPRRMPLAWLEFATLRQNLLKIGSHIIEKAAAIAYTLIETARLIGVDPQAWLAQVLERFPDYKINRADEFLPWNTEPVADLQADR